MKRTFVRMMGCCVAGLVGIINRGLGANYDGVVGGSAYNIITRTATIDGYVVTGTEFMLNFNSGECAAALSGSGQTIYLDIDACSGVVDLGGFTRVITGYCDPTGIWCPTRRFCSLSSNNCWVSGLETTPPTTVGGPTYYMAQPKQADATYTQYSFTGCLPGWYIVASTTSVDPSLTEIQNHCQLCSGLMYNPSGSTVTPVPTPSDTVTVTPGGSATVSTDVLYTYTPSIVSGETQNQYFYWIAGNATRPSGLNTNGRGITSCIAYPVSGASQEFKDDTGTFTLPSGCPYVN